MTARLQGLPAAPGIGIGVLTVYRPLLRAATPPHSPVRAPEDEWRAFTAACARLDAELERQAHNENTLIAELFAAHRTILQDRTLIDRVHHEIFEKGESALTATHRVISDLTDLFRSFEDEYFAGRAVDILDLGRRLLTHLGVSTAWSQLSELPAQTILLAYDLTPSELAMLPLDRVQGIGLAYSTPTAHSAIIAHSLGIPMVCTLGADALRLRQGSQAIVDGKAGLLLVEPSEAEATRYNTASQDLRAARLVARRHAQTAAITQDGVQIPVYANANRPIDVAQTSLTGADGVGLLRTEYLFLERTDPPSVEEQTAVYVEFIRQVRGPLIVRALDAGGDKPVRYIEHAQEENPFLGLRGIRLLIEKPYLLKDQYRALQQAVALAAQESRDDSSALAPSALAPSALAEVRFLLPMISTADEIHIVRELLREENAQRPPLPLGAMIEVPSAALTAASLAPLVDFLSIGTNDLAQYTLASDRTNSAVARLADPLHPAVLHLIAATCRAGEEHGKAVAVCGEIAGDPAMAPLLLGLGVHELSAPLPDVALIKETVRCQTLAACRELARAALACATAGEVRQLLAQHTR